MPFTYVFSLGFNFNYSYPVANLGHKLDDRAS